MIYIELYEVKVAVYTKQIDTFLVNKHVKFSSHITRMSMSFVTQISS